MKDEWTLDILLMSDDDGGMKCTGIYKLILRYIWKCLSSYFFFKFSIIIKHIIVIHFSIHSFKLDMCIKNHYFNFFSLTKHHTIYGYTYLHCTQINAIQFMWYGMTSAGFWCLSLKSSMYQSDQASIMFVHVLVKYVNHRNLRV